MFKRSERVGELLRHEISNWAQTLSKPGLGFLTITGVDLSDDLTDAKVYFSVLGSDEEKASTSRILTKAVPGLRHFLGRRLESLQRVPALHFVYDQTPVRAQRVMDLLHRIAQESEPPAGGEKPAHKPARKKGSP